MKTNSPQQVLFGIIALFIVTSADAQQTTPYLDPQFQWFQNPANGHYYGINDFGLSWQDAESYAVSLGGHLVTINDSAENQWIFDTILPLAPGAEGNGRVWIGLNSSRAWASGDSSTYRNWASGEPNSSGQPAHIYRHDGRWNDIAGNWLRASIIEIECDTCILPERTPLPDVLPDYYPYTWYRNPSNNHYYMILANHAIWEDAVKIAIERNIDLLTINDEAENEWILNVLMKKAPALDTAGLGNAWWGDRMWIGLPYADSPTWQSGETSSYRNWANGEPSSLTQPVKFERDTGKWYTVQESNGGHLVFEFNCENCFSEPVFANHFDGNDLQDNQLTAGPPSGFNPARITFGETPNGEDGNRSMIVTSRPGEGTFIVSTQPITANGTVYVSGKALSNNRESAVAVIALNYPLDGQYAYLNLTNNAIPVAQTREFGMIYTPPSNNLLVGIQVANPQSSILSSTVWFDELTVSDYVMPSSSAIATDAPGNFNGNLENLVININGDSGTVQPFFKTFTDIGIWLSTEEDEDAANVGLTASSIASTSYPFRIFGSVDAQRDPETENGTFGFVITNGNQNLGVFQFVSNLPTTAQNPIKIWAGGTFLSPNQNVPVFAIVQNAGGGFQSSVSVDNLFLFK